MELNKENVIEILKTIYDPDIGLDIYFLGLIYDIKIENNNIIIIMTFTSPMCPMAPYMIDQIKTSLSELEGVENIDIEVTFDPPWTPSDELKEYMGF